MSLAERLRAANLAYRDPALYDDMLSGDRGADAIAHAAQSTLGPAARPPALDLGCGTGRVASTLHAAYGWPVVGVDVQPDLIAYARDHHGPEIRWLVADIRTLAMGQVFEVVLSVGNTLSYLHTEDDLAAFFRVAHAHSHPASVLILATLDTPPQQGGGPHHSRSEITTRYGPATVDVDNAWDPDRQLLTTTRTWQFSDGRTAHDVMTRRIWPQATLAAHAAHAGFVSSRRPAPDGLTLVAVRA